eukprot:2571006-Lingulodinium_polyedra.AAC.1
MLSTFHTAKSFINAATMSASCSFLGCDMETLTSPPTNTGPSKGSPLKSSLATANCCPGGK